MHLVILESPYAGDVAQNIAYAKLAVRDCLERGEAPIASHLLFTQAGILNDDMPGERALGIAAGLAWYSKADRAAFYMDRGVSKGMIAAHEHAQAAGIETEMRYIGQGLTPTARMGLKEWFQWVHPLNGDGLDRQADMSDGRLTVRRHGRPPNALTPWEVTFAGARLAFYGAQERAITAAELWWLTRRRQGAGDAPGGRLWDPAAG